MKRKYYTWLLSGKEDGASTHFGVGMVLRNEHRCRIVDKEAGGDRMMRIRIRNILDS